MRYDIAVVGLGPAGSMFLKSLNLPGARVVCFDSCIFPREKPCAGGLTEKAYKLLEENFRDVDKLVEFKAFALALRNCDVDVSIYSKRPLVYMTDRKKMDYFLLKKASSLSNDFHMHPGERVIRVGKENGYWNIYTDRGKYVAKIVISADGVNSAVLKSVGMKRKVGVTYECDVEHEFTEAVIDFTGFKYGYFWIFPKNGYATVGFGEFRERQKIKNAVLTLKSFLEKYGVQDSCRGKGYLIPYSIGTVKLFVDGILFLGDAGGLVDPFTGEGLYYALKSGVIAASCVRSSLDTGKLSHLRNYEFLINKEFSKEFRWANICAKFFFSMKNIAFKAVSSDNELRRLIADVVCGRASYKKSFLKFMVKIGGIYVGL